MLQSLLVPLDGSEFSERSLRLAKDLAKPTGAALHLAHVHVSHPPDALLSNTQFHYEGLDMEEYDGRDRENEKAYLEGLTAAVSGEDIAVDSMLLEGEVAKEMAAYATRVGADLVLITTHGRTGVKRLWLGSHADALLHQTNLPILVLHPPRGGQVPNAVRSFRHVMVPLDGSGLSASILPAAADLAAAVGARITLVHIVPDSTGFGFWAGHSLKGPEATVMGRATAYLDARAAELRNQGLEVETCVEAHDTPAVAIAELAKRLDADVIALATHGYGGLRRALAGSVADKILATCPLPLLVQRPVG